MRAPPQILATGVPVYGADVSRGRDPISEEGASYQKVLAGLKGLHQRVHDLSAAHQPRPSVAPEVLQSLDAAITELEDEL